MPMTTPENPSEGRGAVELISVDTEYEIPTTKDMSSIIQSYRILLPSNTSSAGAKAI